MTELFRLGLQLLAMLIVLGGAAAALVRFGRRKSTQGDGPLALVARMPLEGRRVVYLVRAGRRVLVVGGSEAGLTRLADFESSELALPATSLPEATTSALPELDLDSAASAADLLRLRESPVPPRSVWRRTPQTEDVESELDGADFTEPTGSRPRIGRTETKSSRPRSSDVDAKD